MSIPFLLDEKPTVVPVNSAGERSGGAREELPSSRFRRAKVYWIATRSARARSRPRCGCTAPTVSCAGPMEPSSAASGLPRRWQKRRLARMRARRSSIAMPQRCCRASQRPRNAKPSPRNPRGRRTDRISTFDILSFASIDPATNIKSKEPSRVASFTFEFQRIDEISDSHLCSAAGFAAGKGCARTPLAASFGATLLLHSEAFKKTFFLQLVDQTFIENLFYGSVCYRAILPLSDHLHADAQPFPAKRPWVEIRACAKIVIGRAIRGRAF
jgi:hypothetical protein